MSDWDEIQRLAADLQRAQLSTGSFKLSERNCVEIVSKLVSLGLLDVIYTCDGKEYLTHQQLQKEISDEVYMNGGRLELPELANLLNVDFSQVEAQANQLVKNDNRLFLVLGQLISSLYLDRIAEEINDKLQLEGTISIPVITKDYNLPSDFVFEQITARLGSLIEGFQDESNPKVIVTQTYVARNKAKIRAVLRAITVPTSVHSICNRFGFESRLFFRLSEELIREGAAAGVLTGGRQSATKASFVPSVYAKAQSEWVDSFFAQNGYLEYDALRRLGITEPEAYIRRKFSAETADGLTFLSSCCLGRTITDNVAANVDEALANGSFVDVVPFLPSVLTEEDWSMVLQPYVNHQETSSKSSRKRTLSTTGKAPIVLAETVVTCQNFLDRLAEPFKDKVRAKAEKAVGSGQYGKATKEAAETMDMQGHHDVVDKKEERRKKAAGGSKAGGGTQGREGKTKSTKAKKGGNKRKQQQQDDWDSDEERVGGGGGGASEQHVPEALKFMSAEEISTALRGVSVLQDCDESFVEALGVHLQPTLSRSYLEMAAELHNSTVSSSMQQKRKSHSEFQEKTLALIDNIRLFDKGLVAIGGDLDAADKAGLEKYLVKSLCTDLVNGVFVQAAGQHDVSVTSPDQLNADQRIKLLGQIPKDVAEHLLPIHKSLNSNGGDLLESLDEHLQNACDVMIKKIDKKKDRQLLFAHRQSLLEQVESCTEPSQLLLLVCLVTFQFQTGQMIHASGKFVPALVGYISEHLEDGGGDVLKKYQSLVIDKMQAKNDEQKLGEIQAQLEELTPLVRKVATEAKKSKN